MSSVSAPSVQFFVLAKKDTPDLITSCFNAGRDGDQEAILVFTGELKARRYLQSAEWLTTETVAELQSAALLRWLVAAVDAGVDLVVIDPDRIHQQDGMPQNVMPLQDLLNGLGPAIRDLLTARDFSE
ncbi:MAG: hypothetical protein RIK87_16055 [Fuerstiella sp.]